VITGKTGAKAADAIAGEAKDIVKKAKEIVAEAKEVVEEATETVEAAAKLLLLSGLLGFGLYFAWKKI